MKLGRDFYLGENVVDIAKCLLGCTIFTNIDGVVCSALIAETEAYAGVIDKASHAWGGRLTTRTSTMYQGGGKAYVYLCYGMHSLFNVVTGPQGVPHAVLIRGAIPLTNVEKMQNRFGPGNQKKIIINGPGKFSKAMGIVMKHNGIDLNGNEIWIEQATADSLPGPIIQTTRIGIHYAGEDAKLPYRFYIDEYWKS